MNHWAVRAVDPARTRVTMRGEVDLHALIGALAGPIMKWLFGRQGARTAEELKYDSENGRPHPRIIAAIAREERL